MGDWSQDYLEERDDHHRRQGTDLRHDAARRRAVGGHRADDGREARHRPAARPAGRRRHRGGVCRQLARRLRSRPHHRRRGPQAHSRLPRPVRAGGHRRRVGRDQGRRAPAHPHVHLQLGRAPDGPAPQEPRRGAGPGDSIGRAGQALLRRRRVLAHGRHAYRPRIPVPDGRGLHRRGRDDGQHTGYGRLRAAIGVRRAHTPDQAERAEHRPGRHQASTATTTWATPLPTASPR